MLSQRRFLDADQAVFAKLSGDYNPMHMDPVVARRTQAGAAVVHGVHLLLWGLDLLAASKPDMPVFGTVKARFDKMVYVGDTAAAVLTGLDEAGARLEIRADGKTTSQIVISFAAPRTPAAVVENDSQPISTAHPIDLSLEDAADRTGRVAFVSSPAEAAEAFPALAKLMGADWLRSTLATTTLVGMVCPGLHSIFGGLTLNPSPEDALESLAYRVTKTHPKFRVVRMDVSGSGLAGVVESFVRHPPTAQADIADLAQLVAPDEFVGATALVIGGSRGLGELTAKLLCAGGAHVIGTYAVGVAEAEAVAAEVRAWGGKFDHMAYDVTKPAAEQLLGLPATPTHLYYFATPGIARGKAELYVVDRFAEFRTFYIDGFYNLFTALRARAQGDLTAFYPSSIFVEDRPADMTEYAMAKAAGEVVCADIQRFIPGSRVVVNRLPKLPTDQTASLIPSESIDPAPVMLPLIREVQAPAG
jgi:acyl dehydratase